MNDIVQSIFRNATGLALFALVTVGAVAVTFTGTQQRIQDNVLAAQSRALNDIVPIEQHDNSLLNDTIRLTELRNVQRLGPIESDAVAYQARWQGNTHTVILPVVAPNGYTTAIRLLVGINQQGEIVGVRVVEHKETPGLGDKIDLRKSDWVLDFNQKTRHDPSEKGWAVKKDGGEFDQFTGATITPRAVVAAVYQALLFFDEHQDMLLGRITATGETPHEQ
ncbi:MAG: electron transport complex subunit RsxG [Bacterioplanes sp.]|nr:electron transport complex subunit RsxG [Bacterioplanes sp.]